MRASWRHFTPFLHVQRALATSRDATALADIVTHMTYVMDMEREHAVKLAVLAGVTGDLGVTLTALHHHLADGQPLHDLNAAGYQRSRPLRAQRDTEYLTALCSLARNAGGFVTLIAEQLHDDPADDHLSVIALLTTVREGNPRRSQRIARLLDEAADFDLLTEPPTPGQMAPMPPAVSAGMHLLTPPGLDTDASMAFDLLTADAAEAEGHRELDPHAIADTLTALHKMASGTYYVGHTIDQMQADLIRAPRTRLTEQAWTSRSHLLPHRYLGERGGWYGPDQQRKTLYRDSGQVILRRTAA